MNKNGRKKRKKTWSSKFFQAKIGFWNPWSYSYERHDYCRRLGYDILGLTELHNVQAQKRFSGKTWVHSAPAEIDENGKNADPAAGVAIMLSSRMANKMISSGHVGTRIAWARIAGPVCNIFYVVVYIPHKGRTTKPMAKDTIMQLKQLLRTVNRSDCIILGGDFNCQLPRNVEGCTGQWSMTQKMQKGHGQDIIDLMREHNLFAVDTLFKPKRKMWNGRYRYCNATYLPKDREKMSAQRTRVIGSTSLSIKNEECVNTVLIVAKIYEAREVDNTRCELLRKKCQQSIVYNVLCCE